MIDTNVLKIIKLRELFIAKINSDWESKWRTKHGGDSTFSNLKSQSAFLDDLLEDIEKEIKNKIGLAKTSDILISKDNLRRILNSQEPSHWKKKTKQTLAYYNGFDGWADFSSNSEFIITDINSTKSVNNFSKIEVNLIRVITSLIVLLSISTLVLNISINKLTTFEVRNKSSNLIYPTPIDIKFNLPFRNYLNYEIWVDKEKYEYAQLPTKIKIDKNSNIQNLVFFTPGQKEISLVLNNKKIKNINFTISTNNSWFSTARIKKIDLPQDYKNFSILEWYGLTNNKGNTNDNYLTSSIEWTTYLKSINFKFPKKYLEFPVELLRKSSKNYTRVAYVKSGNFNVRLDSIQLTFDAKKTLYSGEDCLSFECVLEDKNFQQLELYSTNSCEVESNIKLTKLIDKKNLQLKQFYFSKSNLNKLFEDYKWHTVTIKVLNNQVEVTYDNTIQFSKQIDNKFINLSNINFIFDGNGIIDNVKIINLATNKVILNDTFN